jgi:predicted nucleotidyltransferase
MKTNLLDLSTKIDTTTASLFGDFAQSAQDAPWFVIGATARDLLLHFEHSLPIVRATRDVDLGVHLASWLQYKELRDRLLKTGKFTQSDTEHRLYHITRLPLDLIPFGGSLSPGDILKWPAPASIDMNVTGYEDVLQNARWIRIRSNPNLEIRVATPAGITILKTLAWADNQVTRIKDAQDLAYILMNYLDLGNWGRLQDTDADIAQAQDFDTVLAGAQLLGRDIAKTASPKTTRQVLAVLSNEPGQGALLAAAMAKSRLLGTYDPFTIIQRLERGIKE